MGKKKNSRKWMAKQKEYVAAKKRKKNSEPEVYSDASDDSAVHISVKFGGKRKSKKQKAQDAQREGAEIERRKREGLLCSLPEEDHSKLEPLDSILQSWRGDGDMAAVDSSDASEALKLARKGLGLRVTGVCPPPVGAAAAVASDVDKDLPRLFSSVFARSGGELVRPTPCQAQCWPALLSGSNLLGIAPTGSGKTLAYGIPIVHAAARACHIRGYEFVDAPRGGGDARRPRNPGPLGLVLVPTRELAGQVAKDLRAVCRAATLLGRDAFGGSLTKHKVPKMKVMAIYGGVDRNEQLAAFEEGEPPVHIIAATPGRLLDLLGSRIIGLNRVICLVLDEADRMLQLGFSDQIDAIARQVRPDRQTILFSATFPQNLADASAMWVLEPRVRVRAAVITVGKQARNGGKETEKKEASCPDLKSKATKMRSSNSSLIVENDASKSIRSDKVDSDSEAAEAEEGGCDKDDNDEVEICKNGSEDETGATEVAAIPSHIVQIIQVCAEHEKPKKLVNTVQKLRMAELEQGQMRRPGPMLVFFTKIETLKSIGNMLTRNHGIKCMEFHGQIDQEVREKNLTDFKAGKTSTLLCTDLAARGIHVNRVMYVVNYDFPGSLEQYVHRCGRAGRNHRPRSDEDKPAAAPLVCSFFTRELAPMAKGTIDLLRRSGSSWIDPKLVELAGGKATNDSVETTKKRKRRKKRKKAAA